MKEIVAQFILLWGIKIGSASTKDELLITEQMKQYDIEELLHICSVWAAAYNNSEENDTVDFFNKNLEKLYAEFVRN